ncbi:38790_t:CDS:2 [Gigaspora margarita]|uniref:38790_t:CDS:1 n=2 Tax=Gigaspora margarita TaxID=4874 RepID=A0ABN7UPI0_GIGMA|nr:kxDL motif-containing protein 1 [Gigaspora margarita]CAG8646509.1 38790_t:CDS:2 [Gigaspora margarita]
METQQGSNFQPTTRIMKDMINNSDLDKIVKNQTEIHQILESTASSLTQFNEFSSTKYDELAKKFELHTKCIKEMKIDLEYIFKKLRLLRTKIASQHPDAFEQVEKKLPKKVEDDD